MLPPCWKRVAAAPHYRATHLRRAAGKPLSKHVATSQALADFPRCALEARPSGGVSHESSRGLMDKASPFNGEDCGFESRWEPLQLEELWIKKTQKKRMEGAPFVFLTAVGAKKSERPLNLRRNRYALSAKTGRCQRRFYGRRRD